MESRKGPGAGGQGSGEEWPGNRFSQGTGLQMVQDIGYSPLFLRTVPPCILGKANIDRVPVTIIRVQYIWL